MAGLLDDFTSFIKTPEGQGLLSGVFGYAANAKRGQPINSLGRGGIAGLMGYAGAQDREAQQADAAFQQKYRTMQMGDMQRKMEQQAAQQKWLETLNPSQARLGAALGGGGGPTNANAAKLGAPVDPSQQMMWDAARNGVIPASDYIKTFLPDTEAYTLGEGQVRFKGGKEVARGPEKRAEMPSAVREYEFARTQGFGGSFQDWVMSQKRAGAPSVAVNMADPTAVARAALSFQKDYRDATKAPFARATAYNAMVEASRNPSAKGDLTMVYSFVKALDPESVVREGEIDLVNANRNIPDRVKGYAQRLATGQSLLPSERQDLLEQARNLSFTDYSRSRNDIKAFRDNAARLGLDPELYAPDPYQGVDFGPRKLGANPTPSQNKSKPKQSGGVVDFGSLR